MICAHQEELSSGGMISESIHDFSKLLNELGCFKRVLTHLKRTPRILRRAPPIASNRSKESSCSVANMMIEQSKISAVLHLGNNPSMYFNGNILMYVPFVIMFQNTFETRIPDSSSLFSILFLRIPSVSSLSVHLKKTAINKQCVFLASGMGINAS